MNSSCTASTSIDNIPPKPIISRFIAPWDASGWYSVRPELDIGKRPYSNSDIMITALPIKYRGWEYIMTFDSLQDGFDDKQEVNFYLEQAAIVYVALEKAAPFDFLSDFVDTGDEMQTSNQVTYRILGTNHPAGAQVHIPGFSGNFHHYIVFVCPLTLPQPGSSFTTISANRKLPCYPKRDYIWYFHETFNAMLSQTIPAGFSCCGDCKVMNDPYSRQRKYVLLKNGAYLQRQISTSGQEILELSLQLFTGTVFINFCGIELTLENNQIMQNGKPLGDSLENLFALRFIRQLNTDSQNSDGYCQIWINDRRTTDINCICTSPAFISISVSSIGMAALDSISLRDNPEIFVLQEDFLTLSQNMTISPQASAIITSNPFSANKNLCLTGGSCSYAFQPVTECITLETRVKPETSDFVLLSELRNADGLPALRIAMYQNNLYASNGCMWERIFSGSADWMYYPCGNWYHVKIMVDLLQNNYQLYIDGAKRTDSLALCNPVQNISQIIYYAENNQLYIDELRVYDALSISRGLMPPNQIFDVKKTPYSALGDGQSLDTAAIQAAINDAAYTGGTVYLHDGIFLTGSLQLHPDITFFIDRSATLLGSQDHTHYPLYTPGNSLCTSRQLGRGLLYGQNLSNVRITGGGTLDGQGLYRFKMNDPVDRMADARPCLIYITYSNQITLEDLRLKSSAFWSVVPLSSQNILIQDLDLNCMNTPNRDGIDPVDCHDMTIRRCYIMAGDDGLCFKSSDIFGCENIDVSQLMIQSLASGIKFGTDSYYSFKNIQIRNCVLKNINRCGISLESVDGAEIENILFEEIDMIDVGAPVYITIGKRQRCPHNHPPVRLSSIDHVQFKYLRFAKAYPFSFTKNIRENMIIGQSKEQAIRNISFTDCCLELAGGFTEIPSPPRPIDQKYPEYDRHGLSDAYAFCIHFAENIRLHNCQVILEKPDVRPLASLSAKE
ncbi:hypothetical protein EII17_01730 [Clostridiales bacterium COT073_COT-073]|nr:hypothetical protein EII17_01730 [Clostridiales bacterium COT073_COT-073]